MAHPRVHRKVLRGVRDEEQVDFAGSFLQCVHADVIVPVLLTLHIPVIFASITFIDALP